MKDKYDHKTVKRIKDDERKMKHMKRRIKDLDKSAEMVHREASDRITGKRH